MLGKLSYIVKKILKKIKENIAMFFYNKTVSCLLILILIILSTFQNVKSEVLFEDTFEKNTNEWSFEVTDGSGWEIGQPIAGNVKSKSGYTCAATLLDDDYSPKSKSLFISPSIILPNIQYTENITLSFWQYYSFGDADDYGYVKLEYFDNDSKTWSSWINLLSTYESYAHWHISRIDLSKYAGKQIRIAFAHYADSDNNVDVGWFIDDIVIKKEDIPISKELPFYENFEINDNSWITNRGLWEIGTPINSGINPKSGLNCVVTNLAYDYPKNIDSMLISPSINLPNISYTEEIILNFWQYYSFGDGDDYGNVKLEYFDNYSKTWSSWITLLSTYESYAHWHVSRIDLSKYAGKKIRIAFAHYADSDDYVNDGWFIDDITIAIKSTQQPYNLPFFENFESEAEEWFTDRGVWEIGFPKNVGINSHNDSKCAATILQGYYPTKIDSQFISPAIQLPSLSVQEDITLSVWQNYSFGDGDDYGSIRIQYYNFDNNQWSSWNHLYRTSNNSGNWHEITIKLTNYSSKLIRISFFHVSDSDSNVNYGWYIDDLMIAGENKGTIYGKILATINEIEVPIGNCSVSIIGSSIGVVSDSNGAFIIPNLPLGKYSLRVYKDGFAPILLPNIELTNNNILDLPNVRLVSTQCGLKGDVNDNGLIGLEEAIHALKVVSKILQSQ